MTGVVRVALVQIIGHVDALEENRFRATSAIREAFNGGTQVVVLPELITSGYAIDRESLARCAEGLDGRTVAGWTTLAREFGGLVAGGFAEAVGDDLYDSAVVVGPDGPLLHYRKLHLFDTEKDVFAPGDLGLPVASSPVGQVGLCVCYDLRFPEVVRILALKGAEMILVPTAWVVGFDSMPWDGEGYSPQARGVVVQANLNQVFIACASQVGEEAGVRFLGSSLIADPFGGVPVGPLGGDQETVVWADIDPEDAARAQTRSDRIRPREDRRTDIYRLWVEGEFL